MKTRQSGFLSAEALLGVTMITGALALGTKFMIDQEYQAKAESAGQTMQTVTQALNAYLAETFEVLSNQRSTCDVIQATTSPTTFATDQAANPTCTLTTPPATAQPLPLHLRSAPRIAPGVQTTSAGTEGCGLNGYCWRATDLTFLSDAGKLPAGFSNHDQYGNTLNVMIRVSGTAPNWTVDAIVVTSGAIKRNDRISIEDAGTAAAVLGADGGVVRFATADDLSIAAAETPPRTLTEDFIYGFGNASGGSGRLSWVMERTDWLTPFIEPGQVVARAGYQSSTWSSYLRRDGTLPMTGNLDMGRNTIKNLRQVALDSACTPDEIGQIAELRPINADPDNPGHKLGSGYLLTCGYDQVKRAYLWRKATAGVVSVDDAMAGTMDGYETGTDWVCWEYPAASGSLPTMMKWVMYRGSVYGLRDLTGTGAGPWQNVTYPPGGYSLNVDYTRRNPSFNTGGMGYNIAAIVDPSTGSFRCIQGQFERLGVLQGNPDALLIGDWYFGPNGIVFQPNGRIAIRARTSATGSLGDIPVTGSVSVSGANCTTTCVDGVCGAPSCSPNGGFAQLDGRTVSMPDDAYNRIVTEVIIKDPSIWTFQRRSNVDITSCLVLGQICSPAS